MQSISFQNTLRFCFSALLLLGVSFSGRAQQTVVWGQKVVSVTSQAGAEGQPFSAQQALGPMDALPKGQLNSQAWSPKRDDSPEEMIEVTFGKSYRIRQVIVAENFNPGAISKIEAIDTKGTRHVVYTNANPGPLPQTSRTFSHPVPYTTYRVLKVAVTLNCAAVPGPNQIDAIGISELEKLFVPTNVADKGAEIKYKSDPVALEPTVNTKFTEVRPVISPDGNTLYFARQFHPDNTAGKGDEQDIWYSASAGKHKWKEAIKTKQPLNNRDPTGVCSVTPDGNTLLLINTYNHDGTVNNDGSSISYKTKDGWSFPAKVNVQNYYNKSKDVVDMCLANNGKILLMAVQRDDGQGSQDLFVSFAQKFGVWSKPLNLGPVLNTKGADFAPFLASDNKTLYFASDGHGGYGKSDIFYTKRLDDTWTNWSKPLNLGPVINTADWDAYYSLSAAADYAYFVSTRAGAIQGSKDIFRIEIGEDARPEPVMMITGRVINIETQQPMQARITYQSLEDGVELGTAQSDPATGEYRIVLPKGITYAFMAEAEGFIGVNENITVEDTIQYSEVKRDLYMVPFEVGQKVQLNNIFFERSKYYLRTTSYPELNRLVKIMKEYPSVEILIEGHTDNQGNPALNKQLSLDRVNEVKRYLVGKGIDKKRMVTKGLGDTKPLASNATEESRKLNRRVEFTIIKK
jgi:outer membrane protein OmpA-like peptidoglycan-associated protein